MKSSKIPLPAVEPSPILDRQKSLRFLALASLLIFVILLSRTVYAAQATLAWDPSSDTAIAGYRLYWGSQSQQYMLLGDVGKSTSETVSNLQAGTTYYFAATAYDGQGNESGYSNEVTYTSTPDCTYSITPGSAVFTAEGGMGTVNITTQSSCEWGASSPASWVTITSGSTGMGNGSVGYAVTANTTSSSRIAASTIAGQTFAVTQAAVQTYTVLASAGIGGTVSPSGKVTVPAGGTQTFNIEADAGYAVANLLVDGVSQGATTTYTFGNVEADHALQVSFSPLTYTLSVNRAGTGNGTVTSLPSGDSFPAGTNVILDATPASGSTFTGWSGACSGTSSTCTVTLNANLTATATFDATAHTITAFSGKGGSISPPGTTTVAAGASRTYTITPDADYAISDIKVDGKSVGKMDTFTFEVVSADHDIQAAFSRVGKGQNKK